MYTIPLTLFHCSLYEFEDTLSSQKHAGVQIIIPGDIYISKLNITKYIHRHVGIDQTYALIVDHLHLSATHPE